MYNERKYNVKITAIIVSVVVFVGIVIAFAMTSGNNTADMGNGIVLQRSDIRIVRAANSDASYVSQTVTATINPSTVVDKYVTWSVAWAADAQLKDKDISEYIKVTDDSQGNLKATVNCYKSFKGSKGNSYLHDKTRRKNRYDRYYL